MEIKRKKVGIIYNFSPKWMGGVIYVLNVVKVLSFLKEEEQPEVYLFYNPNLQRFVNEIDYPHLHAIEHPYPSVYKTFLKSLFTGKNQFVEPLIEQYQLDAVYPLHDYPVKSKSKAKLISWYADLQHMHYPQFFSKLKRLERWLRVQFILKNTRDLVVSSYDVKNDFYAFFDIPTHVKFHVYHFVSIVDTFPTASKKEVCAQFNLPENYFVISNQFHKHKNHKVALKAIAHLKKQGQTVHLVMTGKLPDDNQSAYIQELKQLIATNALDNQVHFLGVIPRDAQLAVMWHADAILQPSLFEGWSTVIEDAISLQKPVIAANLCVNVEQLKSAGFYFSPHNYRELAEELVARNYAAITEPLYEPYDQRVTRAAYTLKNILFD
jgi:glycosyltransferase involved in cell wall biosynthesis